MIRPKIVLGPPGTGKTTRLIEMVQEDLKAGTPPDRIAYLSFTRRAAEEARQRAMAEFKLTSRQLPWFRTLHSLCFAAMGLSSAEVLEGKKMAEFGKWLGVSVSAFVSFDEGTSFGFEIGDRCLFMDNLARVRGIPLRQQYESDSDGLRWNEVENVSRGLAEYKRQNNLHDFTDMLAAFVKSDWRVQIDSLYIDEAQDLSALQWQAVEKLARGVKKLVVAGDDDQAIYRWAGADVEQFVDMPGDEQVLSRSWRVPPVVQDVALSVLSRVTHRRQKEWSPDDRRGKGEVSRVRTLDDIDFGTGENVLVLARNTCFLRDDAIPLLRSQGILFSHRGANSVRQSVVDAIVDWERLRRGEKIQVTQAEKIYEQMKVGESFIRGNKKLPHWTDREVEVSMQDLVDHAGLKTTAIWHEALTSLSQEERIYMTYALRRGEKFTREPTVRLSTIHGSKGGQADHVVLMRDVASRTATEGRRNPEDEARCWYVGVTRARKKLTIVAPATRLDRAYDV